MARKNPQSQANPSTPSRTSSSQTVQQASSSTTTTTAATKPSPNTSTSTSTATIKHTTKPTTSSSSSSSSLSQTLQDILPQLWSNYLDTTPARTKLLDTYLFFLLTLGGIQFLYCVVFGTYPYNAFLSGFGITVGQFVLTTSLRIQINPLNAAEFVTVSAERAFADYVLGSLVLHFFCVNFIN